MSNGVLNEVYQRIENANTELTNLLVGTGFFTDVIRGYPENINIYQGTVATSYVKGGGFEQTMGGRNLPTKLDTVIGIITRGTKTEAHDEILHKSLYLLERFQETEDWITLKGNVRNTVITGWDIFPEHGKKRIITTAVVLLEHDINWRGV